MCFLPEFAILRKKGCVPMLKFPCLVLDHDDTVVQSEATINYPCFCEFLEKMRLGAKITLKEYTDGCYHQGFIEMCKTRYQFTDDEMDAEYHFWKEYIKNHIPEPFPGIKEIIQHQKAAGGLVCVVSHSIEKNITRDYLTHFGLLPDAIFGWDMPEEQRKPNPYPLLQIMEKYSLSPNDLLVVDDMRPAWEMARKVQVPIAFAGWGKLDCPEICAEMTGLCDYAFQSTESFRQFLESC